MGLKDNWNKTDETCPSCGHVTKQVKGITKQNLKRLLVPRFSGADFTINILIIAMLVLAWRYQVETKQAKEYVNLVENNRSQLCLDLGKIQSSSSLDTLSQTNLTLNHQFSDFKFNNDG